jgi:predicted site-specific integrase-resolvase
MTIPDDLLTLPEAGRILKVHPRTIKRWWQANLVKLVLLPMGQYRIHTSEVDRILKASDPDHER